MGRERFLVSFLLLTSTCGILEFGVVASWTYTPLDNYLIDCGSYKQTQLPDGRTFKSDHDSTSLLSTDEDVLASVGSISLKDSSPLSSLLPLYQTARIFVDESTYSFYIAQPGRHWVRMYFYPVFHPDYNLTNAVFTVTTDEFVLIHDFSMTDNTSVVFKEYLVNVTQNQFSLKFKPKRGSMAFVNAMEVVSAPDFLIPDSAPTLIPAEMYTGVSNHALEVSYRINVGGPVITPRNDTLSRTWQLDNVYMTSPQVARNASIPSNSIKYAESGGVNPYIAPNQVYSTADQMADPGVSEANFNLTWKMKVDPTFAYLIRMHFCDIVSETLNQLYFNVYINEMIVVSGLDLSTLTSGLGVPYYTDFVVNASSIVNETVMVQVGPSFIESALPNAILNGLEVIKLSNSAGSLDGLFGVDAIRKATKIKIMQFLGVGIVISAMVLLVVAFVRLRKGQGENWENSRSSASWLLPLNASQVNFWSSKSISQSLFGSKTSKSGNSGIYPNPCLGRSFTLSELKNATCNFDEKAVVGVGGFGKVYLGELGDGTKLAIKRGSKGAGQGINEFQTEIEMLSKLRHRHLVSLVGYCDEQSEMILVYEYMANGPFRDHLYGSNMPSLSWKQRLEICIGAARGLHYLHTGAAQSIIHRDVKTTNILLDENFVAKVSDFGLSKAFAPTLDQTHVSTAVKGSFGYLDPEYFRRQQLSEKSDVYSFGVVLLEVLCTRPAINPALPREQVNLAEWAMQCYRKGMLESIIDPHIVGSICPESLNKYIEAAEKCLAEYGIDRPGMGKVLWYLEYALQLQEASSCKVDIPENTNEDLITLGRQRETELVETSSYGDNSEVNVAGPFVTMEGR